MKQILVYTNSSEFVARNIYNELKNRGIAAFAYENGTLLLTSDVRIITSNEPARIKASAPFDNIFDRTRGAQCIDLHRYSPVVSVRSTINNICEYVSRECQYTRDNGYRGGFTLIDEWSLYCEADVKATMNMYKTKAVDMLSMAYQKLKPQIKNVIFNDPATIVFWSDGTKTVVKTQDGEMFDPEKGLAMAISKKALGNNREYYHTFLHWLKKYEPTKYLCMYCGNDSTNPGWDHACDECSEDFNKKYDPVQAAYDILVGWRDNKVPVSKELEKNMDKIEELIGYLGQALED